jgi:hypothetical protein
MKSLGRFTVIDVARIGCAPDRPRGEPRETPDAGAPDKRIAGGLLSVRKEQEFHAD